MYPSLSTTAMLYFPKRINSGCGIWNFCPFVVRISNGRNPPPLTFFFNSRTFTLQICARSQFASISLCFSSLFRLGGLLRFFRARNSGFALRALRLFRRGGFGGRLLLASTVGALVAA